MGDNRFVSEGRNGKSQGKVTVNNWKYTFYQLNAGANHLTKFFSILRTNCLSIVLFLLFYFENNTKHLPSNVKL